MNILLLTTHVNHGGITSYVLTALEHLIRRGHRVYLGCAGGALLPRAIAAGAHPVPLWINTKHEISIPLAVSYLQLRHFLKRQPIDVIHAQTRVAQVLAGQIALAFPVPVVTTCHGFFRTTIGRQLFPCWGRKVIAVSEAVKKHLMLDFLVPSQNIACIPNGIDLDVFTVSANRFDPERRDRRIGIVARLSSVKGHQYLVEAMSRIIVDYPDARLYLFGEGKYKRSLLRTVASLKLEQKILFLPAVANTARVMQEIDIFAMPSLQEGLGLAFLEAQACGVPVVGTTVGGIPSIINDGVNGVLVPPRDSQALAAAIMKIMDNRPLAIEMGKNGRQRIEQHFSATRMIDRLEEVYAQVTG